MTQIKIGDTVTLNYGSRSKGKVVSIDTSRTDCIKIYFQHEGCWWYSLDEVEEARCLAATVEE